MPSQFSNRRQSLGQAVKHLGTEGFKGTHEQAVLWHRGVSIFVHYFFCVCVFIVLIHVNKFVCTHEQVPLCGRVSSVLHAELALALRVGTQLRTEAEHVLQRHLNTNKSQ